MKNEQTKQRVTTALFFDGTGNNRTNSMRDSNKFGHLTNINTLFDACTLTDRLYVEGVGTRDNMDDSNVAKGTGENPPGYSGYSYNDKLEKGTGFLKAYQEQHVDDDIDLLVFGFSRGATLARDFAKRALAYSNVRIKYLGIYDTVVSLLLRRPAIQFTASELQRVDRILHLTAIHEARKYFPLTSLIAHNGATALVDIKNSYSEKVKEIFVPGAHADVGGGYNPGLEYIYLNNVLKEVDDLKVDLAKIRTTVQDQFSGSAHFPIWKDLLGDNIVFKNDSSTASKKKIGSWRSNVAIDMTTVYFEVMATYANAFVNSTIFDFTSSVTIPSLVQLKNEVLNYINSNDPDGGPNYDYAALANFTHISSNYGPIENKAGQVIDYNTFDAEALRSEIKKTKEENPSINSEWLTEEAILEAFELEAWIDVNAPNNGEWHRKVIYG